MQDFRQKYLREEYTARINRVIDYIEANISKDLSLKELASEAHFSPFHFHRIFGAMVGETLNNFIKRLRVEKAASMLVQNHRKSITEIALECGFSGSSTFARAFQEAFGMSASNWRGGVYQGNSKNGKTDNKESQPVGNIQQDFDIYPSYSDSNTKQIWRVEMKSNKELITDVEVKEVQEMNIAYIRHIGPYAGDEQLFGKLFNKLCTWAGPRGLLNSPDTKFITIYHDNPDITDESKLRTDVCITVPPDTGIDGEIGKAAIPAGYYAIAHFEINADQFGDAWNAVYGGWLPESGYQPDDRPCFELYLGEPSQHPEGKHLVDIYAPVKPM
ncbi:GyrI-like domain-containing protein [Chloroflexota bacterium]